MAGNGVSGDPLARAEYSLKGIELMVEAAVRQFNTLIPASSVVDGISFASIGGAENTIQWM